MKLLTSQKDYIYEVIELYEFSPSQFKLEEYSKSVVSIEISTKLKYNNSEFYFLFESDNSGSHFVSLSPGLNKYSESFEIKIWEDCVYFLQQWLSSLKKEINTPNKWERLEKEMKSLNISSNFSSDKFSASEYEELKQRMNELKEGIKALEILPEQIAILIGKVDYLTELAITMNKYDWGNLFIGYAINISTALVFSEEARNTFIGLIRIALSPIILIP